MLLLNIEYVPGKEIEALGLVKGTVVQSKNFGKDFMAGMKTLVGGEITGYTEMLIEARQIATKRMVDEAEALGADAVPGGGRGHQRPLRLGLGDAGGRRGHRLRNRSAVQVTQFPPAPCSLKRVGTAPRAGRQSRRPVRFCHFHR